MLYYENLCFVNMGSILLHLSGIIYTHSILIAGRKFKQVAEMVRTISKQLFCIECFVECNTHCVKLQLLLWLVT